MDTLLVVVAFLCLHFAVTQAALGAVPVFTVDGAHLKHGFATRTVLILCARDGHNANITVCLAVVASESNSDVQYFFNHVKEAGLEEHPESVYTYLEC